VGGNPPELQLLRDETSGALRGAVLTVNISPFLSDATVCSLSEILIGDAPPKYFLSPRACAGILRRAAKRGRSLPPSLQAALEAAAQMTTPPGADISSETETEEDETEMEAELEMEEPWEPSAAPPPEEDGG
jgi:hypothetical protein